MLHHPGHAAGVRPVIRPISPLRLVVQSTGTGTGVWH